MSVAFTTIKGVVFCDSARAYNGITLLTPLKGKGVWAIDMQGKLVNHWETEYEPGCYGELLPTGNLLYAGKVANGPLVDLEGAGGILLELDWHGNTVWEYKDSYLHHAFYRRKNGNTLILKWVKLPEDVRVKVKGGDPGTERSEVMWGDTIQEITPDGKLLWEWVVHEHLDPDVTPRCPICPRDTWTHANAVSELPDGNILVSFMKTNTITIIDKKTGKINWQWGPGELGHQHCPNMLDNGNILVFDNGFHPNGFPPGASRVLEVDPDSGEMVWSYRGQEKWISSFYSSTMSSCQRLPNGNTFICEGTTGRLFEISPGGDLVWEFINNLPSYEPSPTKAKSCMVYSAYRYGMDYSGLKGQPVRLPTVREPAPGTPVEEETVMKARLGALGY